MFDTQSQTTVTASGNTGDTCSASGPYKCNTNPSVTIFVKKGDTFPSGPPSNAITQGQNATWTMVS